MMVPKNDIDQDITIINLYNKFHFNMCNPCEENERRLLVDRLTDRPTDRPTARQTDGRTAAKLYALPSSKRSIKICQSM